MILSFIFIYTLFSAIFLWQLYHNGIKMILYLPLYWFIEEILSTFYYAYDSSGTINILTFVYILYAINKLGLIRITRNNIFVLIFLIIALINTPFKYDILSFTNRYLNLFNIYLILPISMIVINSKKDFLKLKQVLENSLLITITYLLIASANKIGPNMYNTEIIFGLRWSQYYGPALASVFILNHYFNEKISYRNFLRIPTMLISILMIAITVFTLRRTAILILLVYVFVSFIFTMRRQQIIYSTILGVVLIISLLYIDKTFKLSQTERGFVFSKDYDITTEGRYYDIFGVLELMESESKLMTGYELFNEYGNYGAKRDTRPIHVDLARIFYGVGIIGIIPFILIFISIILRFVNKGSSKILTGVFLGTLSAYILTLFTGGTLYLSYSGLAFIILGGTLNLRASNTKILE